MRWIMAMLGLVVGLAAGPAIATGQVITREPVLQPCFSPPDLTCANVTFWTDKPVVASVGYGPNPLGTGGMSWTNNSSGEAETNPLNAGLRHRHQLRVFPGQDTQYEIWLNGALATRTNGQPHQYTFVVPGGGDTRCYTVMADWAVGGGEPFNTWRNIVMPAWDCRGLITAGDNGYWYPTNEWAQIDKGFFRPWNATGQPNRKPWLAEGVNLIGLGNHDNSAEFKSVFPGTYRFHDDPLTIVHMTTCGGCGASSSAQGTLRNFIREGKSRGNVVVVVVHYPFYPCMYTDAATASMRQYWKPILEQEGASLVIQGHEHGLAVSKPHNGITYVTTGGASDGSGHSKAGYCTATGNQPSGYPAYDRTLTATKQISRLTLDGKTVTWEAFMVSGGPIANTKRTFTATGGPPPVPPKPVLTLSSDLTWAADNATSCTKSGSWSGTAGVTGSETVTPGTYTLTCTGPGGSVSQTRTITGP